MSKKNAEAVCGSGEGVLEVVRQDGVKAAAAADSLWTIVDRITAIDELVKAVGEQPLSESALRGLGLVISGLGAELSDASSEINDFFGVIGREVNKASSG